MPTPIVVFNNTFNVGTVPPQITFSDQTNYSSYGINNNQVTGIIKMTGPTGVFHNGDFISPDINLNLGNTFLQNLPTTLSGSAVEGSYTILYKIRVAWSDGILATTSSPSGFVISGDRRTSYTPGTQITVTGPNAGTYVVIFAAYNSGTNQTGVAVQGSLPSPGTPGGLISVVNEYSQTATYSYCYKKTSPKLSLEADCDCAGFSSSDLTNYTIQVGGQSLFPSNISRVHTVRYPINPNGSPVSPNVVSNSANIELPDLWTGTYQVTLVSTLTYIMPGGLIVVDVVQGEDSFEVECNDGLCCVYKCLANIVTQYEYYLNTNAVRGQEWALKLQKVLGYWMIYSIAKQCGQNDYARAYLDKIIEAANQADCKCCPENDDAPVKVVPICGTVATNGSGGNTVVSAGNGIQVQSSTVGNTTTYQVSVDQSIINSYIASWIAAGNLNFDDLADVNIPSPQSGLPVLFNGIEYVQAPLNPNNISSFSIINPQVGQVLAYDGVNFTNAFVPSSGVLYNEQTAVTTSGTGVDPLMSFQVPANTLSLDGDVLLVKGFFFNNNSPVALNRVVFQNTGANFLGSSPTTSTAADRRYYFESFISRVNNTMIYAETVVRITNGFNDVWKQTFSYYAPVNPLDANVLELDFVGQCNNASDVLTQQYMFVQKIKK